jgi:hypothetical protein
MNMWHGAADTLSSAQDGAPNLNVEQKLKVAEVKALLSISQELSRIHHLGINPSFSSGSE